MATPLVASCPECRKQIKASDELVGKKVRCKGCGHVFVIPAAGAEKPKAAPAKAKAAAAAAEEEDGGNPYALANDADEQVARCPHCAKELDSPDAKICVNCGYNTVTRQRHETKKVVENSGGDQFMWLLPGLLAVAAILVLIVFDIVYVFLMGDWLRSMDLDLLATKGFRLWVVIATLFAMFFLGKFGFQRLVLNPTPPERVRS